jgi:hypothetical protein
VFHRASSTLPRSPPLDKLETALADGVRAIGEAVDRVGKTLAYDETERRFNENFAVLKRAAYDLSRRWLRRPVPFLRIGPTIWTPTRVMRVPTWARWIATVLIGLLGYAVANPVIQLLFAPVSAVFPNVAASIDITRLYVFLFVAPIVSIVGPTAVAPSRKRLVILAFTIWTIYQLLVSIQVIFRPPLSVQAATYGEVIEIAGIIAGVAGGYLLARRASRSVYAKVVVTVEATKA